MVPASMIMVFQVLLAISEEVAGRLNIQRSERRRAFDFEVGKILGSKIESDSYDIITFTGGCLDFFCEKEMLDAYREALGRRSIKLKDECIFYFDVQYCLDVEGVGKLFECINPDNLPFKENYNKLFSKYVLDRSSSSINL